MLLSALFSPAHTVLATTLWFIFVLLSYFAISLYMYGVLYDTFPTGQAVKLFSHVSGTHNHRHQSRPIIMPKRSQQEMHDST